MPATFAEGLAPARPEVLRRAVGETLLVDADLPGDDPVALLELGELLLDAALLLAQQLEALRLVPRARTDQLRHPADLRQGHPGSAQLDADPQPVHVVAPKAAVPARSTFDLLGYQQALALVIPQRMHA